MGVRPATAPSSCIEDKNPNEAVELSLVKMPQLCTVFSRRKRSDPTSTDQRATAVGVGRLAT
jgi:hypothetical protein